MSRLKNVILLGRKPGAARALEFLLKKGIRVKLVVAPKDEPYEATLARTACRYRVPVFFDDARVYHLIEKNDSLIRDVDLVISYLYLRRIFEPLIKLGRRGCINFHPAPLPDYKGRAGYNTAVLHGKRSFGVSCHFIDSEEFDAGPLIRVERFPIDPKTETVFSLESKTQKKLFELFCKVIRMFRTREKIRTRPNRGGLYWTAADLEAAKKVDLRKDSAEDIHRKIRAFFFPPHHGAIVELAGEQFTLLNEELLHYLHKALGHEDDREA